MVRKKDIFSLSDNFKKDVNSMTSGFRNTSIFGNKSSNRGYNHTNSDWTHPRNDWIAKRMFPRKEEQEDPDEVHIYVHNEPEYNRPIYKYHHSKEYKRRQFAKNVKDIWGMIKWLLILGVLYIIILSLYTIYLKISGFISNVF